MKYIILSCSMILLSSCQFSSSVSVQPDAAMSYSGQSTNTSPTLAPEKLDSGVAPTPSGMSR